MSSTDLTTSFSLAPQNFEQAMQFANMMADSDMVPKDFKGKPGNCLIAMQWGHELGMQAMQAVQNIAVINGRPAMWGDAVIALVRSSPLCEYITETDDGQTATCRVKRKGQPEEIRTFSIDDARTAGLFGKQGPWTTNPKRMRQMRARGFALRDVFPDVLRGMAIAEEAMDLKEIDMGMADVVREPAPAAETKPEKPGYPEARFKEKLQSFSSLIAEGKKTAEDIITTIESNAKMSDEQKKTLRAVEIAPQTKGEVIEQ